MSNSNLRLELGKDISLAFGLAVVRYEKVPVNSCPDDDPAGEPRPMKIEPVTDLTPFIDFLIERGWTKK